MSSQSAGVGPKQYLAAYCIGYLSFGLLTGSLGPIIPYLAKERNKQEHQYSSLFMSRTVGAVLGLLTLWQLQKNKFQHWQHKILAVWVFLTFIFMMVFVWWPTTFGQFSSFVVFGGGHYITLRTVNVCLIQIAKDKIGSWLPLTNAFFSTGALVAPIFIRYIQTEVFFLIAVVCLIFGALLLLWPTPIKKQNQLLDPLSPKKEKKEYVPSRRLEILVATGAFLIVGIELTVSGWIPTYAVLTGVLDKKDATICGTLFWLMSTICRFIISASSIKCSLKIKWLVSSIVICSFACLIFYWLNMHFFVAIFGPIAFGVSCSAVFPLLMSVPKEFNIRFKHEQVSRVMFMPFVSSFFLTGLTGQILSIDISLLFLCLFAMSLGLWLISQRFFRVFEEEAFDNTSNEENQKRTKEMKTISLS